MRMLLYALMLGCPVAALTGCTVPVPVAMLGERQGDGLIELLAAGVVLVVAVGLVFTWKDLK